ncbi:GNAT family N-acetyltransferase [Fulvivirgaceae bacterium BMA10]|uniref:GNAT family N-acetyltransferase n=1 Tax=Splendidivirga corallicola TaxID=3051826 RepID=A0ABT8KGK0_9BACT|nr:GNAT family N-acetyltransferase [Fulvivirgaceae bacterium BMA10]
MNKLNPPQVFETERLIVRKLKMSDAADIFHKYAKHPHLTKYVSWPTHKDIEDTNAFLAYALEAWEKGTDYAYAILLKNENELIGSTGFINEEGKVSIGYIINDQYSGKGYTTEAVIALNNWLKEQPEVYRIWAVCDMDNIASVRVLEKAGMEREGVLRNWCKFINQENRAKDCLCFVLNKD